MKTLISCLLLALLLIPVGLRGGAPEDDPAALLREGRALIERNCGDCMGSSAQGLRQGIQKVEKALEMGLPDPAEGYRLLANAYGQLARVFLTPDSAEQLEVLDKQRQAYERLVKVEPKNVEILYEYAFSLRDEEARASVLRRILDIQPDYLDALFALGRYEAERGDPKGIGRMRRAFNDAKGEHALEYGESLLAVLQQQGRTDEAQEVARRLEKIRKDLRSLQGGSEQP
jgi:tetratricopeptide (TPR) repeat protein